MADDKDKEDEKRTQKANVFDMFSSTWTKRSERSCSRIFGREEPNKKPQKRKKSTLKRLLAERDDVETRERDREETELSPLLYTSLGNF